MRGAASWGCAASAFTPRSPHLAILSSMANKVLRADQLKRLFAPLPKEALRRHPTKSFLTVISPIYVLERLNDVFGVGKWEFRTEPVAVGEPLGNRGQMCVVKGILTIPEYGIHLEQYGGNDNTDMGDAYKGAATDALTKLASYLGIGFEVYKGKRDIGSQFQQERQGREPPSEIRHREERFIPVDEHTDRYASVRNIE